MDFTGIGSVASLAKGIMDKFWPPDADPNVKIQAEAALTQMVEERENKIVEAKEKIIVAEMQQGDTFTKRARPAVVYTGLGCMFINYVILPGVAFVATIFGVELPELPTLELPTQFWVVWGSVCSIWSIGRSAERRGASNKIISMITGNK